MVETLVDLQVLGNLQKWFDSVTFIKSQVDSKQRATGNVCEFMAECGFCHEG